MADFEKFLSKFQLVKLRSRKLTVIILVVAMLLSMGALTALHIFRITLENRTEDLRSKAAHLEAENEALLEDIEQVDSIQSIVEIAEEELGLVQPDAVFYQTEP